MKISIVDLEYADNWREVVKASLPSDIQQQTIEYLEACIYDLERVHDHIAAESARKVLNEVKAMDIEAFKNWFVSDKEE